MNISFGNNSIGITPIIDTYSIKQDFIKNCNTDNKLYPNIDELGNPKFNIILPFIIMIICIMIMVFTFIKSAPEKTPSDDPEKPKERPYIVIISLIILCILCVLFGLYGIYLYIYIYYPEYDKWFKNLSPGCKDKHKLIINLQELENEKARYLREQ
jgi:NADH:ubiquinone oxidoreductase subunit 5 (subunit L)/multisubunit Na+/H+ antiporter MnhA subunit